MKILNTGAQLHLPELTLDCGECEVEGALWGEAKKLPKVAEYLKSGRLKEMGVAAPAPKPAPAKPAPKPAGKPSKK